MPTPIPRALVVIYSCRLRRLRLVFWRSCVEAIVSLGGRHGNIAFLFFVMEEGWVF